MIDRQLLDFGEVFVAQCVRGDSLHLYGDRGSLLILQAKCHR